MSFVVLPLLREWQELSASDFTQNMINNVTSNKLRWEEIHEKTKPTHDALATTSLTDDEEHVTSRPPHATRPRSHTVSTTRRTACTIGDVIELTRAPRDENRSRDMRTRQHRGVTSLARRRNSLPLVDLNCNSDELVSMPSPCIATLERMDVAEQGDEIECKSINKMATVTTTTTPSPKLNARKALPALSIPQDYNDPETLDVMKASPPPFLSAPECYTTSRFEEDDVMTDQENESNLYMFHKLRRCSAPTVRAHLSCLDNTVTSQERRVTSRQQQQPQQSSLFVRGASKLLYFSLCSRRNSLPLKLKDLTSAGRTTEQNNNEQNNSSSSCKQRTLINACS